MNPLPQKEIVEQALERICSDPLFRRSRTNELILRFLVKQAFEGNDVKEQVIGLELFKNDYSPEQNDSKIRVAVYYLRKKLSEYYSGNGRDESLRFVIKKGQYNLSFEEGKPKDVNKSESSNKIISIKRSHLILSIIGLIVVIVSLFFIAHTPPKAYCWSSFFSPKASNICILSDHFVAQLPYNENGNNYVLNREIRNREDLLVYNKNNPGEEMKPSHFPLFTKMAPISVQNLTSWFKDHRQEFTIRMESELRYEDFKENNLLFLGQAKNMILSESVFLRNSKKFAFEDKSIFLINGDKTQKLYSSNKGQEQKEYAMVSFNLLENDKEAFYFVSEHDVGVMATVRNFTDPKWLKSFYQSLPKGCKYFNALFEVDGVNRSDVECRLVEIELLEP